MSGSRHGQSEAAPSRWPTAVRRGRTLLPALAVLALVVQVLALCAEHFQPNLNSDDLYLYLFCQDVLGRGGPLAGWTLGSAPYFFPDVAGLSLLLGPAGLQGFAIPLYACSSALALAVLVGWVLSSLEPAASGPWWRGLLVVNLLLALRGLTGMDRWLWQELSPGFHGGTILVGLALTALVLRQRDGAGRRWEWGLVAVLLWLGAVSDALMLVQFGLPPLAVLGWRRRAAGAPPVLRQYARSLATALGLLAATRLALTWGEVFFFSRVFRAVPTPARSGAAAWRLLADLGSGLWPVAVAAGAALLFVLVLTARRSAGARDRWIAGWVVASVGLTVAAVVGLGYWTDELRSRYLLNLLVVPLTGAAALLPAWLAAPPAPWRRAARAGLGLALGALTVAAWPGVEPARLTFPAPADIRELDAFLQQHQLQRGLADYWTVNRFNVLSRSGARLSALRSAPSATAASATAYFWANNAYTYLDRDPGTGAWLLPRYTFIVANRLDQAALLARYGEPRAQLTAGPWLIWILADPDRVSRLVGEDVRTRLAGRRWRVTGLAADGVLPLAPPTP